MSVNDVLGKLRTSVRHRGLIPTVYRSALAVTWRSDKRFAPAHPFDLQHKTDTSGTLWAEDIWVGSSSDADNMGYAGVSPSRLRGALEQWTATLEEKSIPAFSFVDLGCGKGRALLVASEYAFREALGVEINVKLAGAAKQNIEIWKAAGKTHCPLRVIQGDVRDVPLPPGPCLVFIYNSFGPSVISAVLDALAQRVSHGESGVDLLFQNEGPESPLRQDSRLRLLWTGRIPLSTTDAAYDPVASREDVTSLYRWIVTAD